MSSVRGFARRIRRIVAIFVGASRGGTFRRNLRRPEITDVEAMALVRRAIARLLHDDPERVLSWEDLPALTESEKRRVDDAMKDVADALDRYASAACPNIDELWESLS